MRGMRKRAKTISPPVRTRRRRIDPQVLQQKDGIPESSEHEVDSVYKVDTPCYEAGSFASRSTVRLINEVVSKFDPQKRQLVKSIGFHGILEFPPIKQFNRKFTMWLMSCVDEESCSLCIGDHISIQFNKADVARVFGIPSSGNRILDDRVATLGAKKHVLGRYLGDEFKEIRSIKLVQEVLEREYDVPMSKIESDTFRVAFVVFVASNLLAPSSKYDYASIDYWNAIQDPDSIMCFDWAEYVLQRLLKGVAKLRKDVASNIKFPNITGCSLFLQVLYLDSLDLGSESLLHNSIPRISFFSYEKMRSMIVADSNYTRFKEGDQNVRTTKQSTAQLRDPNGCIYSWASDEGSEPEESHNVCSLAIWESAVAMVQLLNIPLEAAGPIFVAALDFQNQVNCGLYVTGTQALKFMSVLVSIMIPYRRGFRYQCPQPWGNDALGHGVLGEVINRGISLMARPIRAKRSNMGCRMSMQNINRNSAGYESQAGERSNDFQASSSSQGRRYVQHGAIGDYVSRSVTSVLASLDSLPHYMNVNLRVATVMSEFYELIRKIKAPRGFDLNVYAQDQFNAPRQEILSSSQQSVLPSPWDLGMSWGSDDDSRDTIIAKLSEVRDDEGLVIAHSHPKYIQVNSPGFRDQFMGKCEMELDLFDALIRRIRQEDEELYGQFGQSRWRLFFESDFMASIVSGSFDLLDANLREHMSLSNSTFDISSCKLMFFPALLQFSWVCFVWVVEENAIHVFDPSNASPIPESRVEAIERCCYLLKLAIQTLSRSVFIGSTHEASFAEMHLITLTDPAVTRMNLSGVICSLFCRTYDGVDLKADLGEFDTKAISARLLVDVLKLKHNSGKIPEALSHLIKI